MDGVFKGLGLRGTPVLWAGGTEWRGVCSIKRGPGHQRKKNHISIHSGSS